MYRKYLDFMERHKKQLLVLLILVNLASIYGITRIRINPEFNIFSLKESAPLNDIEEYEKNFPSGGQMTVLLELDKFENSNELENFDKALKEVDNISQIESPYPLMDYDNYAMLGDLSPVYEKDSKYFISYSLLTDEGFSRKDIAEIENAAKDNGLKAFYTGEVYMQEKIITYITYILLIVPPLAMIILINVFRFQMRTLKSTFLSMLPAITATLWTMGFIGYLGNKVSIITVLVPIYTIVIGSADGLHFVAHIQDERHDGKSMLDSISRTLKMVGIPMIITTITSMAGFLSLMTIGIDAMHDLAKYAAIGIFLAGVATWVVVPLVLLNGFKLKDIDRKPEKRELLKWFWGKKAIAAALIVILVSLAGLPFIKTEFNFGMIYRDFTAVKKSFDKIEEVTGGTFPLFLITDKDSDTGAAKETLLEEPAVSKVIAPSDVPPFMAEKISAFASIDGTKLRSIVYPASLDNEMMDKVSDKAAEIEGSKLVGMQLVMKELNGSILKSQRKVIALSLFLVFVLVFLSTRKLVPSIISLIPIAITSLALFGYLGLTGISLNLITATIFSITIGVGIDYAIHYTSIWQSFVNEGKTGKESAELAYRYTHRPVMANAFGFALGLSALMLSPLKIHVYVSSLMWLSMLLSVFLTLSLLPTLLGKLKN